MKHLLYLIPFLLTFSTLLFGQELDWLKKSTSNDVFTTHSFYTSTQHNNDFYFAGDFWKDLTIDGENITIGGDLANGFIVKMDENGLADNLWHFKSDDYVRINKMQVHPISGSLIATGYFRNNLMFNNETWTADFYSKGFVMSINPNGTLDWIKLFEPQSDVSSGGGDGLAIDDDGNIFVGIEAGGDVNIDIESFSFEPETAGVIIIKLDVNGDLITADKWDAKVFEGWIDIIDMTIDNYNDLLIGGCLFGSVEITDSTYYFSTITSSNYLMKLDADLNVQWLKSYPSTSSHVLDILVDGDNTLLSVQYNTSINVDGKVLIGTGSWGETAIISINENAELNWVKNFTLTENSGIHGVYGKSITKWNDQYYIAGVYQGDVEHNGVLILDNSLTGGLYSYPFIISLNDVGDLTSTYDFVGSSGPGRISSISSYGSHLLFGGDFSNQISIGDTSINTINSTLFYGALTNNTTSSKGIEEINNLFNLYPTSTSDYINIKTESKINNISLISSNGILIKEIANDLRLIDVQDLIPGVYYLNIDFDGKLLSEKFIKL